MKTIPASISSLVLAAFVAGFPTQVLCSGFALIENSASGQGNAFAGAAAAAEDASTIWFNPAGMMKLDADQILVAGHFISPESSFANGNSVDASGSPLTGSNDDGGSNALTGNFYWIVGIADNLKFGLGVNTPFGLATVYDDTWTGRYHAVTTDLKTININPSFAYRIDDRLSLGGGINILLADVELTSAIDFGSLIGTPQAADGFGDLTGDNFSDPAWGINLGLMYDLTPDTVVGIAWRSESTIKVKGDAVFTVPSSAAPVLGTGAFVNTGLRAEVTLPQSFSVSIAHDMDSVKLLADITWTGWSSFEELRIVYDNPNQPDTVTTESWKDTFRYSIGADYTLDDRWTVRGGLAYDETPIPGAERRTPRVPGNSRTWVSIGGTYVASPEFTVDVGYSHLFVSDTQINNTLESRPELNATLKGTYKASVDILSAQLRWNY